VIDPTHKLSLTRQAQLLQLSRASLYYEPAASAADLQLMRRLDELHLQWPFLGSRMLRNMLRLEGIVVGRRHVATLTRKKWALRRSIDARTLAAGIRVT
jgi:putative transposase